MANRPKNVPKNAVWVEADREWVVKRTDDAGHAQGLVSYFRADGSLVCECEHVDDIPHGTTRRFHETGELSRSSIFNRGQLEGLDTTYPAHGPTTERGFPPNASASIVRYEQFWQGGIIVWRHFLAPENTKVNMQGVPYPPRPNGVPESALPSGDGWRNGAVDQAGYKISAQTLYRADGSMESEDHYDPKTKALSHRTRRFEAGDEIVAFVSGAVTASGNWIGSVTLLDEAKKPVRDMEAAQFLALQNELAAAAAALAKTSQKQAPNKSTTKASKKITIEKAEPARLVSREARTPEGRSGDEEFLGTLRAPSGSLVVVDFGLMGGWNKKVAKSIQKTLTKTSRHGGSEDNSLEDGNVIAVPGLPTTNLKVVGVRNGKGDWPELWNYIEVKVSDTPAATVEEIAGVYVERARLMLADPVDLSDWIHEGTIDGRADLVFWGRDAEDLAKATDARRLAPSEQEYGFVDLPLEEARAKFEELGKLCERNGWMVRPDPREHDHHHFLLKAIRESKNQAAAMAFGAGQIFGFMTGYGDGIFPVERCLDAEGNLVGLRVRLGTRQAILNMNEVNGRPAT